MHKWYFIWRSLQSVGCFHLFLYPEGGLVRGIESSNSQWYRLHFNTIIHRLLLLRQRAEIKAVSTGNSPGRFSGSLLWCFSCHPHHHQRHQHSCPLTRTHTRSSSDKISLMHLHKYRQNHTNAHAHINTLRKLLLGIMIMKEIECATVGVVCVTQQLWC